MVIPKSKSIPRLIIGIIFLFGGLSMLIIGGVCLPLNTCSTIKWISAIALLIFGFIIDLFSITYICYNLNMCGSSMVYVVIK